MDGPSHQNNSQKKGKGTGRRKIAMKKIENDANLQVTFSKRRAGLFKKASEIDTLCGTESAVVAFSPSEKVHSYGNPDVETITEKFVNQTEGYNHEILAAHNNAITRQRNQKVTDLERQLEMEKKYKKELNRMRQEYQSQYGAPPNLDELTYQQLEELKKSVLNFKQNFEAKVQNPMGLDNSYVQGPNPNVGMEGGFPAGEAYMGFPSGSNNIQGGQASYMGDPYANKEANFSNYPGLYNNGPGNDSHVPFPNNVEPSYPSETFFSDMMASNEYVDPFDPMANNLGPNSFQYPNDVADGSNLMDVPFDGEATVANVAGAENVYAPWGTTQGQGYVQNNTQGFHNNYGGGGSGSGRY